MNCLPEPDWQTTNNKKWKMVTNRCQLKRKERRGKFWWIDFIRSVFFPEDKINTKKIPTFKRVTSKRLAKSVAFLKWFFADWCTFSRNWPPSSLKQHLSCSIFRCYFAAVRGHHNVANIRQYLFFLFIHHT